jgi:hypothetical protein
MNITLRCFFAMAILLSTGAARAQEVTRLPDTTSNAVGLDTGLEGAFVARATYTHRFATGPDARLYARAVLPFVTPDLGDWAIDGGVRVTPLEWGDLRLSLLGGPVMRRAHNDAFSSTALGFQTTLLAGYEGQRWGLMAEAGYEQLLATYQDHEAAYRETYYANAKDGWYAFTGSTLRAGLRGGARFGSLEVGARAGINTTGELSAATPPLYLTIGTSYVF